MRYEAMDQIISRSIRKQLVSSIAIGCVFLGGIGAAAAYAEIRGAVMASGS